MEAYGEVYSMIIMATARRRPVNRSPNKRKACWLAGLLSLNPGGRSGFGVRQHFFADLLVMPLFALRLRQGDAEHVFDPARVVDRDAVDLVRRQVLFHVLPVFGRQDHVFHASAFRRQELLLDAARPAARCR